MSEKAKRRVEILVHAAFYGLIVALVLVFFNYLYLFLPLILAFILVAVVNPLVRMLNRKIKIKQSIVAVVIMALMYIIAGGLLFLVILMLILALQELFTGLPAYFSDVISPTLGNLGASFEGLISRIPPEWSTSAQSIQDAVMNSLQDGVVTLSTTGVSALTGIVQNIPNFLVAMIFTILLSFFISMQYEKIIQLGITNLPEAATTKITEVVELLKHTVFEYSKGILKLMFITFIELMIGFIVIGIDNPVGMAAGIALFDALPVFGTGGIMIPWVLLELLQGNFQFALYLGILYAIITVIRNIIEPKIIGDQLELNPIISLTSIYLGFRLFGFLGMIFFPILTKIGLTLYENGFFGIKPKKLRRQAYGDSGETGEDGPGDSDNAEGKGDADGSSPPEDSQGPEVPGDGELLIPAEKNKLL